MTYAITPADFDALVDESSRTSPAIAAGDAAIVLLEESGFDPTNPGPQRADPPVGGLNQMSVPNLASLGLTREAWLKMTAAEQLPYVFRFWKAIGQTFNGGDFPHDAPTILALNYLPGSYRDSGAKTDPNAAISGKNGPFSKLYDDNIVMDPRRTGKITVNTIGTYLGDVARDPRNAARWALIQAGIHDALARRKYGPLITPTPAPDGPPVPPPIPPTPAPTPTPAPSKLTGAAIVAIILGLLAAAWAARGGR